MAIGFGFGMSHAPGVHMHRENTVDWLNFAIDRSQQNGWVIPAVAMQQTPQTVDEHWLRFRKNHAALRGKLAAFDPDAIVIFGSNTANFPTSRPAEIAVFTGPEAYGFISGDAAYAQYHLGEPVMHGEERYVHLKTDVELATKIVEALQARGTFSVEPAEVFEPRGGTVLGDDFANPTEVFHRQDVPVVIISLRYEAPGGGPQQSMDLSGRTCYELGRAVAEIVATDPKRIAICGSGGLSHDPRGPRNMWIDETLDRWVLAQIEQGNGEALANLFEFDSMTLRGGTREIAAWIAAAGAMEHAGAKATVLDYICDAPEVQTGIGFACWDLPPATARSI